jgi:cell division protein FtsL
VAQTALAHKLPVAQPEPLAPQLRALPGAGRAAAAQPALAPWLKTLFITGAVLIITLATVSVMRVSISNLTVQQLLQAQQTSNTIETARAVGTDLEVKHALLSNPTRVQDAAIARGVLPGNQPAVIQARHGFSAELQIIMATLAANAAAAETAEKDAEKPVADAANNAATEQLAAENDAAEQATVDEQISADHTAETSDSALSE